MDKIQDSSYRDKIKEYILLANIFIKDFFEILIPIYRDEFNDELQDVTTFLFTSLHSTSESILLLSFNESALYDADVLLRTVMEGTVKFCYLLSGTKEQRKAKYKEYKVFLTEINELDEHEKSIESIAILKKFSNYSVKTLELDILEEQRIRELEEKYSKNNRRKLSGRWSYKKLLNKLAETDVIFESQLATLSAYSFSSHLIHYDWSGLSTRQSQILNAYSEDRLELSFGHAIRILSNVLSFYNFRVIYHCKCYDIFSEEIREMVLTTFDYIKELDEVANELVDKHL
ncbi:DUF5677 domain-containing protein [Candidatus Enterococcus ferrettii]|uniref:HEPN AbiU2-like domain-containing protein n=1 Tax=Candidatus Enterococcus ferrettii TaxID=2815324 RepID=A0ABV0EJR0_9ENTE|nr:DUF5677 domain-containing protein [Enterococcus sp. 665A]MBO1338223.1 hypothetical protein [Enterococcus sp. 665A]